MSNSKIHILHMHNIVFVFFVMEFVRANTRALLSISIVDTFIVHALTSVHFRIDLRKCTDVNACTMNELLYNVVWQLQGMDSQTYNCRYCYLGPEGIKLLASPSVEESGDVFHRFSITLLVHGLKLHQVSYM